MIKGIKITLGIALILFGWFCIGMALVEPMGGYNTIVLFSGLALFILGVVIIAVPSKSKH